MRRTGNTAKGKCIRASQRTLSRRNELHIIARGVLKSVISEQDTYNLSLHFALPICLSMKFIQKAISDFWGDLLNMALGSIKWQAP